MKKLLVIFLLFLTTGCGYYVDENEAIQTLQDAGYSNISVYDKSVWFPKWNGCGENDDVAFECTANNIIGKRVKVTVCSAFWMKNSTIRH